MDNISIVMRFFGVVQKQSHEGLGLKWAISYNCRDMCKPILITIDIRAMPRDCYVDESLEYRMNRW